MPDYYYGFLIVLGLLIVLAALVAKRRMSKIDHLPPEHRAKENELYEAFGLEVHQEEEPEDHEVKEEEIEEAFGHEAIQKELEETFSSEKPMKQADKKKKKGKNKKGKKKGKKR